MKALKKLFPVFTLASLLILSTGFIPGDQEEQEKQVDAKGIYHDSGTKRLGAKFHVQLVRGDKTYNVPTTYPFRSGDKIRFTLEANKDCFVYVLNRTFTGDPDDLFQSRSKGIVYDEDRVSSSTQFRILFPTRKAGTNNLLNKDTKHVLPHVGQYVFDEEKGIEKLYIILSRKKFTRLDQILDRIGTSDTGGSDEQIPTDEDQDVLSQLMKGLKGLATVQYGSDDDDHGYAVQGKGIEYDAPESESGDENALLVTVNLAHN